MTLVISSQYQSNWIEYNHGNNMEGMEKTGLAERTLHRMRELDLTQEQLAEMCGVSQGAIHKIISGKTTRPRIIYELAKSLRVTPEWLKEGKGSLTNGDNNMHAHELRIIQITRVPVLRWDEASKFLNMPDDRQSEPIKYITVPLEDIERPYALIVEGDAMVGPPGTDSYPPGCYIVLNPDGKINPGSHVIAHNSATGETVFRVLRTEGSKRWLTPLNTQYHAVEMTPDFAIIGVVEGVWIPRRK